MSECPIGRRLKGRLQCPKVEQGLTGYSALVSLEYIPAHTYPQGFREFNKDQAVPLNCKKWARISCELWVVLSSFLFIPLVRRMRGTYPEVLKRRAFSCTDVTFLSHLVPFFPLFLFGLWGTQKADGGWDVLTPRTPTPTLTLSRTHCTESQHHDSIKPITYP